MKHIDKSKHIVQLPTPTARTSTHPGNSTNANTTETPGSGQTNMRVPGWVLLPLRLFLGVTFVYAGIEKLTDLHYFDPRAAGYIGKQIHAFAIGSPLHDFLIHVAMPHANLFGALVAFGEVAIGLATLLGLLLRPAAFFGMVLSLVFFLSASWRDYPYFYGADIVFLFCWITMLIAGPVESWIGVYDTVFVPRILAITAEEWRPVIAQMLYVLLGVRTRASSAPAAADQRQSRSTSGNNRAKQVMIAQQVQTARRNFLSGLIAGGGGMLALLWLARNLHLLPQSPADTALTTTSPAASVRTPTAAPTDTAPVSEPTHSPGSTHLRGNPIKIAQVNSVPTNSAVTFTLPSNNDPGVLIHLGNDTFVAYDAICTHAGCPVQYDPSSKYLICPCHGAVFDPANAAAVVQGPAYTPLTSVPISINNAAGSISISG